VLLEDGLLPQVLLEDRSLLVQAGPRPGASWRTISSGAGRSSPRSILEDDILRLLAQVHFASISTTISLPGAHRLFVEDRLPVSSSPGASRAQVLLAQREAAANIRTYAEQI
jgi:hypothetical protein